MDRKEVACLTVAHNTAFSVVIKDSKPLEYGRAKFTTQVNSAFRAR